MDTVTILIWGVLVALVIGAGIGSCLVYRYARRTFGLQEAEAYLAIYPDATPEELGRFGRVVTSVLGYVNRVAEDVTRIVSVCDRSIAEQKDVITSCESAMDEARATHSRAVTDAEVKMAAAVEKAQEERDSRVEKADSARETTVARKSTDIRLAGAEIDRLTYRRKQVGEVRRLFGGVENA